MEHRSQEPVSHVGWRRKGGLETPLRGRFGNESRRLTFAPPLWYDALVVACLVCGPLMVLLGPLGLAFVPVPTFTGTAVFLAGIWGAFSNERIACDLKTRSYARLEGQGWRKRLTRGSLDDLDALVLVSQLPPIPSLGGTPVVYRLVLFWKGAKEPLLVVEREDRLLPAGAPAFALAQGIAERGARYAAALGVRFFDNAMTPSAGPLPPW